MIRVHLVMLSGKKDEKKVSDIHQKEMKCLHVPNIFIASIPRKGDYYIIKKEVDFFRFFL